MQTRAPRNRTLTCSTTELETLSRSLVSLPDSLTPTSPALLPTLENKIINQDFFDVASKLPRAFADLIILDPPYNLSKNYNGDQFLAKDADTYSKWFAAIIALLKPTLKPDGSIYVCSDWKTSALVLPILEQNFCVQNRITWEREKGRGAKSNWKNNTEDIWFCTVGDGYYFDVEAVKLKRKVIAPYRDAAGKPKDWEENTDGNFRLTHPSNIWTDITVPFWSMPENTDHPTQKPEKLIAKLILASSREGGLVFDPFLGSGTTAAVCKKLNRRWLGIEQNQEYCCWAQKRLNQAETDRTIQGYADGVFWERNTLNEQPKPPAAPAAQNSLELTYA